MSNLPHHGHWSRAANRRFDCTVVFVHHFGGSAESTKRHQKFVNDLGFDAVAFTLKHNHAVTATSLLPLALNLLSGKFSFWSEVWKNQIRDVCAAIDGAKIIMSFSYPNMGVLRFIAEEHPADMRAWVADGGPFLGTVQRIFAFYRFKTKVPAWQRPLFSAVGSVVIGGLNPETRAKEWLQAIPPELPILSVRCGADELTPPEGIDRLFRTNPMLNVQILNVPNCKHLEALKSHPEVYTPVVGEFLKSHANSGVSPDNRLP